MEHVWCSMEHWFFVMSLRFRVGVPKELGILAGIFTGYITVCPSEDLSWCGALRPLDRMGNTLLKVESKARQKREHTWWFCYLRIWLCITQSDSNHWTTEANQMCFGLSCEKQQNPMANHEETLQWHIFSISKCSRYSRDQTAKTVCFFLVWGRSCFQQTPMDVEGLDKPELRGQNAPSWGSWSGAPRDGNENLQEMIFVPHINYLV